MIVVEGCLPTCQMNSLVSSLYSGLPYSLVNASTTCFLSVTLIFPPIDASLHVPLSGSLTKRQIGRNRTIPGRESLAAVLTQNAVRSAVVGKSGVHIQFCFW